MSGGLLSQIAQIRPSEALPAAGRVARSAPGDLARFVGQAKELRVAAAFADPSPRVLAGLRTLCPRVRVKDIEVRTRAADVLATLGDDTAYLVRPYGVVMLDLAGPFALALDGPEHTAARARIDRALAGIDPTALGEWAARRCAALLDLARGDGRLDVVRELAEPLLTDFAVDHLGVEAPEGDPTRPDETLAVWAADVFEACFANLRADRGVHARATRATARIHRQLDGPLAAARAGEVTAASTVLSRLAAEHTDDLVRTDVIGLLVGAFPTVSEALARVVDHLVRHPEHLEAARAAARGAAGSAARDALWGHVRECLRFAPQAPGLLRAPACPVGAGPAVVFASTKSAMHDPSLVEAPGAYRSDRPESSDLHFGHGPHRCPGAPFARELLVSAVGALLAEPRLGQVPGPAGEIRTDAQTVRSALVAI